MLSAAPRRFLLPAAAGRIVLPGLRESPMWHAPAVLRAVPRALPQAGAEPVERAALAEHAAPASPAGESGWRLAVGLGVLVLLLGAWAWSTVQHELMATRSRLAATERRLLRAEARQGAVAVDLSRRLQGELATLREHAGVELRTLASQTRQAAAAQAAQSQARLDALQTELNRGLARRQSMRPPGDPAAATLETMKRAFAQVRPATLYIRTAFKVRLAQSGEEQEQTSFGTGFLISPGGMAVTAQHVLFPWRYDRRLLASQALGLLEVLEQSAEVSVWLADSQVTASDDEADELLSEGAYRLDAEHSAVRILHVGRPALHSELVMTPLGPMAFELPQLGPGDVAVFQLIDPARRFPYLALDDAPAPGPLDEVLVVGFPLSRLQAGRAVPQVSVGRVRRAGGALLELDAALHPGNSGGPVLNRGGRVVGMASAILDSPVYGLALPGEQLREAWQIVRAETTALQRHLQARGCGPASADGIPGPLTWAAEACGAALAAGL
jgi:hypothetical protein